VGVGVGEWLVGWLVRWWLAEMCFDMCSCVFIVSC
jgi:hypothetical protein